MIIRLSIKRKILIMAVVLAVILAVGLCLGYFINKQSNKTPDTQAPNKLRALLIQNNVLLDSIKFVDNDSPTSAEQHKIIYDKLQQNIKEIEDSPIATDPRLAKDINNIVAAEKTTLEVYGTQTNKFYKILSYNPADDIGTPKLAANETVVKQRAAAAQKGIASALENSVSDKKNSLGGKAKLSDQAIASMQKAQACFRGLVEGSINKNDCIDQYAAVRRDINQSLVVTFETDSIKSLREIIREAVSRLSNST